MPAGYCGWSRRSDCLTTGEIIRIGRAAARHGFRRIGLTGGEPLLRPDLPAIVEGIAACPGVDCVALSTNGMRLAPLARTLRTAGLRTVNVSLDSLDAQAYHRVSGGHLGAVLAGLEAARGAGFESITLNCVLMRDINEDQIPDLLRFAAQKGFVLRLLELTPSPTPPGVARRHFLSAEETRARLAKGDQFVAHSPKGRCWEPAQYYRLRHAGTVVGFVPGRSDPKFFAACGTLRLTADGLLREYASDESGIDLKPALRKHRTDKELDAVFAQVLQR